MNDALIELREEPNGKLTLRGYASVSERWYPVGRRFQEKMVSGVWQRCLAGGPDTVLLEDHSGLGLARTKTPSGEPSLILSEDDRGLRVEAFLDASAPRVQDLRSTSENAGLQMSVGFLCEDDSWDNDRTRRQVKQASVHKGDVTVCNFGANDAASATITERGAVGEKERRALTESLTGAMERRSCPTEFVEVRGRSQIVVPSFLETAKLRRVKLGGPRRRPERRSSVEEMKLRRIKLGNTRAELTVPHVPPRYTYAQIQKLGKEGYAHKRKDGKYNFPVLDSTDVVNAVHAIGRAAEDERLSVKRFIIYRAGILHRGNLIPDGWAKEVAAAMPEGLPR